MTRLFLTSALLLSLTACGGGDSTGKTTTKLDAVEVEPGTISDSMITLDDSNVDGTAVDNSVPNDESKKDEKKPQEDSEDAPADEGSDDPDAVPAPAAKKSIPAADKPAEVD